MRILVIAPHPDDETLGCGGTLLKHIAGGDSVAWAIVTKAHEPRWSAEVIERRDRRRMASRSDFVSHSPQGVWILCHLKIS